MLEGDCWAEVCFFNMLHSLEVQYELYFYERAS